MTELLFDVGRNEQDGRLLHVIGKKVWQPRFFP